MYNEVITLIKQTRTVNSMGDMVPTETRRSVFAKLASVGRSEFYQAAAVGLKPEIKFILPDYLEYDFEQIVEYQEYNRTTPQRFSVIRSYRSGTELELVCSRGVDV